MSASAPPLLLYPRIEASDDEDVWTLLPSDPVQSLSLMPGLLAALAAPLQILFVVVIPVRVANGSIGAAEATLTVLPAVWLWHLWLRTRRSTATRWVRVSLAALLGVTLAWILLPLTMAECGQLAGPPDRIGGFPLPGIHGGTSARHFAAASALPMLANMALLAVAGWLLLWRLPRQWLSQVSWYATWFSLCAGTCAWLEMFVQWWD